MQPQLNKPMCSNAKNVPRCLLRTNETGSIAGMSGTAHMKCRWSYLEHDDVQAWRLTKRVQLQLRMTQQAVGRKMIFITLRNKNRAEWVRDILGKIKQKWVWTRHVEHRQDNCW